MQKDILDTRFENVGDVRLFQDGFTGNDDFGTFDGNNLARIFIDKIFYPRLHHITGQTTTDSFFQVGLGYFEVFCQTEDFENILIGLEPNGTQQGSHGQFLLPVDIGIHYVVDVGSKLDPGTAERNDTGRIELRPVGVRTLAEEDSRRTVQLRYHYPLGTVDDKRAFGRHIGNRAQVNVLDYRSEVLVIGVGTIKFQLGL